MAQNPTRFRHDHGYTPNRRTRRSNSRSHSHSRSPDAIARFHYKWGSRMGSKKTFAPANMRRGFAAAAFEAAVILGEWAHDYVVDLVTFRRFAAAFSILARRLEGLGCARNTIIQLFYNGLRDEEQKQFKYFIRGFTFPMSFTHPDAEEEREKAAMAMWTTSFTEEDIKDYLERRRARSVGQRIGVDFIAWPVRVIGSELEREEMERVYRMGGRRNDQRGRVRQESERRTWPQRYSAPVSPPSPVYSPSATPAPPYDPTPSSTVENHGPATPVTRSEIIQYLARLGIQEAMRSAGEATPDSLPSLVSCSDPGSSNENPIDLEGTEEGEIRN